MTEITEAVDFEELQRLFARIPPGPYDALHRQDGWEVRQIDTDPGNKHHWPHRLCERIAGQTAECDDAVFPFIAGVINAWPEIAARREGVAGAAEALRTAATAIQEYYRYQHGGDGKYGGSYDGKPERNGLWAAERVIQSALATLQGQQS